MIDKLTILTGLAAISSSLLAAVAFGSLWVLHVEQPYVSYANLPFPLAQAAIYAPGDSPQFKAEKCNSSSERAFYHSVAVLVNETTGDTIDFPSRSLMAYPGCHITPGILDTLPLGIPSGTYHFYGTSFVQGKFEKHEVKWESQSFAVVAPK